MIKNRKSMLWGAALFALLTFLSACSSLGPVLQTPAITLASVQATGMQGLQQNFRVGLEVENPNPYSLGIAKIGYAIELEDIKVISGTVNQLPVIKANTAEVVYIDIGLGLVEGLQLVSRLMSKTDRQFAYRLTAELNISKPLPLVLPISESGNVDLDKVMSQLSQPVSGGYSL